jgi:hypothetical protein
MWTHPPGNELSVATNSRSAACHDSVKVGLTPNGISIGPSKEESRVGSDTSPMGWLASRTETGCGADSFVP